MRLKLLTIAGSVMLASAAWAGPVSYYAILSGANENPVNASPGTGLARVSIDTVAHLLDVYVEFSGLLAPNTAAHIHCCAVPPTNASVATTTPTFTGFPGGTTSGTYSHIFDLTDAASYRAGFITSSGGTTSGAEAVLAAGMAAGQTYLNIHTTAFPGGEIRGALAPVPEPATLVLSGAALLSLALAAKKSRARNLRSVARDIK
jgi:hypothetical protein